MDRKGGPQLGFGHLADLLPSIESDRVGWRDSIHLPRLGVLDPSQSRNVSNPVQLDFRSGYRWSAQRASVVEAPSTI